MKNVWGYEIPPIGDIIRRPELNILISDVTHKILHAVGLNTLSGHRLIEFMRSRQSPRDVLELEEVLHHRIVEEGASAQSMQDGMRHRAAVIYSQIRNHLRGESLADVGCGHGLVSWNARSRFKDCLLLDVVDYRDSEVDLPFRLFSQNDTPPFGRTFDCTLLITVLHHSDDPMKLLEDVWKQTSQRLVIIESVFGVEVNNTSSPLPNLPEFDQLCYAVYCDWFYNRVLNQGVPVPYNFNTPSQWRQIFANLPATIAYEEDLGVDLDIVPEHHSLFVLGRE
jgi:hypothetical protein